MPTDGRCAFGGKETQSALTAVMASLVAHRTGRPARLVLDRADDMRITGKRHPYQTDYRVAFDETGRLLAAEMAFYSNGGAFADLSTSVMERTMLHAENAYHVPMLRVHRPGVPDQPAAESRRSADLAGRRAWR